MIPETDLSLTTPFKNIALAFSGGGFRAAAFSLGTLSYLKHLKLDNDENGNPTTKSLLDNVTFISSASGGTITASVYSMLRNKKESFGTIYKKLLVAMNGDQLLNKALEKLNDDNEWNQNGNLKTRNLINAFAKAYDEALFQGEKFGVYWNKDGLKDFEVCFNTTEFRRGLPFRFQTNGEAVTHELIGNEYIHFDSKHSDKYKNIKLGDILAASSCFPSGFEPIVFPEDFSYNKVLNHLSVDELRQALLVEHYNKQTTTLEPTESIGLMDGGITDNQGLDSAMLADTRRRKNNLKEFDLIIVTDVASYFMDAYEVPTEKYDTSWKKKTLMDYIHTATKIPTVLRYVFWGTLALVLISLLLIFLCNQTFAHNVGYFTLGLSTCILFVLWGIACVKKKLGLTKILDPNFDIKDFLKKGIPSIKNFSESILDKLITYFKTTRLGVLQQMISARIRSVLIMVSDVNLKHVRRLIYNEFYNNSKWENRRCSNFIYVLSKINEESRKKYLMEFVNKEKLSAQDILLLTASSKIMDVAEQARIVGTTLWFEHNNDETLKQVVASGQFSTCVNLLEYILLIENDLTLQFSEPIKMMLVTIKEKLVSDWKQFNENPCFLFEFYKK